MSVLLAFSWEPANCECVPDDLLSRISEPDSYHKTLYVDYGYVSTEKHAVSAENLFWLHGKATL